ncbi:MAG: NUDIX domain-containing protein [Mycobacteriales bacterium]
MTVPLERRAARVLLLDADGRVLLQNCCDPTATDAGSWWNTTGGGIDEGETPAQAAARELVEETGLRVEPGQLGPVVHRRLTEFSFGGDRYRQSEDYFLLRTDSFDAIPTAHSDVELVAVLGTRWWSRDELRGTAERVYPQELAEVLDRLAP